LVAWVEIPLIVDGNVLNVYYDNSLTPPDDSNGPDVWNLGNNNLAVWHLNQTTFGANSTLDSTGVTLNNFTPEGGMGPSNAVTGKLDGAVFFDGVLDETTGLGSSALRSLTNGFTFSTWAKPDDFDIFRLIYSLETTGGFGFGINSSTSISFTTFGIITYLQTVATLSTIDTHFAVKFDSSNDATFYVNGVNVGTVVGASPANAAVGDLIIGGAAAVNMFKGNIDEVRIYDTELSDDLIQTIFNNENDAGEPGVPGFYTIGVPQSIP